MRIQKRAFLFGTLILALLAAACQPGNGVTPATTPGAGTTAVPATAKTLPSATVPPGGGPATPTTAAVISPTAPPSGPTPNSPSSTSGPTAGAIAHLAAGQAFTITTIRMLDTSLGWAIGGLASTGEHVFTTSDGGQTWHDVTPPQPIPAANQGPPIGATGSFRNSTIATVVYGTSQAAAPAKAIVWRTSDGGQNWTGSDPIDLSAIGAQDFFQPSDLRFLPDGLTGLFIAHLGVGMNHDYFTIMKTTDGAQTWTRLIDPSAGGPQSCQKTGLHFTDAQNGWLTGDCNGVAPGVFFMRSTDGGSTWKPVTLPAPASQPDIFTRQDGGCGTYSMRLFDQKNAKLSVSCLILSSNAVSTTNFIYSTSDGGQNWTSNPSPARSLTFFSPQIAWALPLAEPSLQPPYALSQSQDGGQTWTTVKQLAWTGQLSFVDAQNGWAVAMADQAISFVKTQDAGHTWQAANPKVAP